MKLPVYKLGRAQQCNYLLSIKRWKSHIYRHIAGLDEIQTQLILTENLISLKFLIFIIH